MHKRPLLLVAVALCLCANGAAAARRRAVRSPGPAPAGPCVVRGVANFFYSTDDGASWSSNAEPASSAGMWDIAVLEGEPETLVGVMGRQIFESLDAGCTWTLRHTIAEEIHHTVHVVPATQRRAYIWTEDWALRYDDGAVASLPLPQTIGGLGVNPGNREHIRILDLATGNARESLDGGQTWRDIGGSAGGRISSAAFDPADFQHILAGVQTKGIMISRNGGRTWTSGASAALVCNLAFVDGAPNVVWVTLPTRKGLSWVQRSTDAGLHLDPVAGFDDVETNICFPVLPDPHDATLAIVPFGDFHTFDAVRKTVTPWSCCGGRMHRIAWSPGDPARVYVSSGLR